MPFNQISWLDQIDLGEYNNLTARKLNDDNSYIIIPEDFTISEHLIWEDFSLIGYKENEEILVIDSITIFKGRNYFNSVKVAISNLTVYEKDSTWLLDNGNHSFNINEKDINTDFSYEIDLINAYNIEFDSYEGLSYPYKITNIGDQLEILNITKYQHGANSYKNYGEAFYIIESLEISGFRMQDIKNQNEFLISIGYKSLGFLNAEILNINKAIAYQDQTGNTSGGVKFWETVAFNDDTEVHIILKRE